MDESRFQETFYREEQRFSQWWIWLIVLGIAAMMWWGFVQQIVWKRPFGTNPAPDWMMWLLLVLFGIGLPLLFLSMKLVVVVGRQAVDIRFWPFVKREILFDEIAHFQVRSYKAIREYGGWGIRGGSGKKMAYNVSGYEGVELILKDGRSVMIGSQRAEALAQAIASVSGLMIEDSADPNLSF